MLIVAARYLYGDTLCFGNFIFMVTTHVNDLKTKFLNRTKLYVKFLYTEQRLIKKLSINLL